MKKVVSQDAEKQNYVVTAAGRIAGQRCKVGGIVSLTPRQAKYEHVVPAPVDTTATTQDAAQVTSAPPIEAPVETVAETSTVDASAETVSDAASKKTGKKASSE